MSSAFGTFVVSGDNDQAAYCRTILGYRDVIGTSTVSASGPDDPDYPFSHCTDYSYSTEYSPDTSVSSNAIVITLTLAELKKINYFSIVSKNGGSSGLFYTVDILRPGEPDYDIAVVSATTTDAVPSMVYFGDLYDDGWVEVVAIKVNLFYDSKPYIMSMSCGEAIVFPRTPSLGFQPATTAYLDEVKQFYADEGLNLVGGRRLSRGKPLEGTINYVKMAFAESFWDEYANHVLDSKPVYLMWNDKKPTEVIYGAQVPERLTKLKYKTNIFTSVDFYIVGWA